MYKTDPLSRDQISQLRIQLTKIIQQNMTPFKDKLISSPYFLQSYSIDTLLQFSENQYERLSRLLQNICQFSFTVMANFDLLWEEVEYRDNKILELRQTCLETTNYIEQLKIENEEVKNKLSQAETYIEWIQQQKQYLDAIYDSNSSTITLPASNKHSLGRCVSESTLRCSRSQKKSVNYEKLKEYIQSINIEKGQLEKQYINLNKKFQIKTEECKKNNLIIEHLVQRLNNTMQEKRDKILSFGSHDSAKTAFTSDEILKMLQSAQRVSTATSLQNNLQGHEEIGTYFDLYSSEDVFKEHNERESASGFSCNRQTKDVQICTESQFINSMNTQTQTEDKENNFKKQKESDFRIQINISGLQDQKSKHIQKIIQELELEHQLGKKLLKKNQKKIQESKSNKPSYFDYYREKLVSNRIKKYYFRRPSPVKNRKVS